MITSTKNQVRQEQLKKAKEMQEELASLFSRTYNTSNIAPEVWEPRDIVVLPNEKTESITYFEVQKLLRDDVADGVSDSTLRVYRVLCLCVRGGSRYQAGHMYDIEIPAVSTVLGTIIGYNNRQEAMQGLSDDEKAIAAVSAAIDYLKRQKNMSCKFAELRNYLDKMVKIPQDRTTDRMKDTWLRTAYKTYRRHIKSAGGVVSYTGVPIPHGGVYKGAEPKAEGFTKKVRVDVNKIMTGIIMLLEAFPDTFDIKR